jgi:hypothetical protein
MREIKVMKVSLDSVGCVMDTNEMMVHAQMKDGSIDLENGVHIDEVSEEWMSTLSIEDFVKVGKVIEGLK